MSYLADDTAAIKARMEEIAADLKLALTGSSAPAAEESKQTKEFDSYGMYAYPAGYGVGPWRHSFGRLGGAASELVDDYGD